MVQTYHFTKIIATLGPSSYSYEKIKSLVKRGVNVFRINFSHGSHEYHKQAIEWVRQVEKELESIIGVIGDLQGPKFRLGPVEGERIFYKAGDKVTLLSDGKIGTREALIFPHVKFFNKIKAGDKILIDDGKMTLEVIQAEKTSLETKVLTDGYLASGKGVNLPHIKIMASSLTNKDRIDLQAALSMGVDYIALSFVQSSQDLKEARTFIKSVKGQAALIAKLEKPAAIENLDDIIDHSDAVIIARGDLGVEIPCEEVPILQRKIIQKCRKKGVPVVVATQMMESMVTSARPTRAEASDVATAVYEGADAVMLSAESASGDHPLEAVDTMRRIIMSVERDPYLHKAYATERPDTQPNDEDAISLAVCQIAETLNIAAIASFTEGGGASKRVARQRPLAPILGITPYLHISRQLSLVWGVLPVYAKNTITSLEDIIIPACKAAIKGNLAQKGDKIVVTAGMPFGKPGPTNLLRLVRLNGSSNKEKIKKHEKMRFCCKK